MDSRIHWIQLSYPTFIADISPPINLKEFERRLTVFFERSYYVLIGMASGIKEDSSKKMKNSLEEALVVYEKYSKQGRHLGVIFDGYEHFKSLLENDIPLMGQDQYLLGFDIDRSKMSLRQKDVISVQCLAQILWYLEGDILFSIELMAKRILNKENVFFELLKLKRFHNERTIKNWVRPIFPVCKEDRKKQAIEPQSVLGKIVCLPRIFSEKTVNFQKLRFAIGCLTSILKALDWDLENILKSKFISLLSEPLKFYSKMYVSDWTAEEFTRDGSIFDS